MKDIRLLEQNIVLVSGYLARDPDVRFTQKGSAMCAFTVGATRRFQDTATGEWKDEVSWVPVVVWGPAAERLKDKLKKGSPVHVEGRLKSEQYEDKTGQKRSALKVVARRVQFLAKSGAGAPGAPSAEEPEDKTAMDLEEVPF